MSADQYLKSLKKGDPVIVTRTSLLNGEKTVKRRQVTDVADGKIKVKGKYYDQSTGTLSRESHQYDAVYRLSQPADNGGNWQTNGEWRMTDDIVERLRDAHPISQQYALGSAILRDAADEITRLREAVPLADEIGRRKK